MPHHQQCCSRRAHFHSLSPSFSRSLSFSVRRLVRSLPPCNSLETAVFPDILPGPGCSLRRRLVGDECHSTVLMLMGKTFSLSPFIPSLSRPSRDRRLPRHPALPACRPWLQFSLCGGWSRRFQVGGSCEGRDRSAADVRLKAVRLKARISFAGRLCSASYTLSWD